MVLSLLTSEKKFVNPWVGNAAFNAAGLHRARMRAAARCAAIRRAQVLRNDESTARLRGEAAALLGF